MAAKSTHTPVWNIRVPKDDWDDYDAVCTHAGTNRSEALRKHIRRQISAFRAKNPDVRLPSDDLSDLSDDAGDNA